jgi:hypothetical protein
VNRSEGVIGSSWLEDFLQKSVAHRVPFGKKAFVSSNDPFFCPCYCHQESEGCDQIYKEVCRKQEQECSTLCCHGELFVPKQLSLWPDYLINCGVSGSRLVNEPHIVFLHIWDTYEERALSLCYKKLTNKSFRCKQISTGAQPLVCY